MRIELAKQRRAEKRKRKKQVFAAKKQSQMLRTSNADSFDLWNFAGIRRVHHGVKVSEMIAHLAQPFLEFSDGSIEMFKRIICMTIVGWNLTVVPPEEHSAFLKSFIETLPLNDGDPGFRKEMIGMMSTIVNVIAMRKEQFYPDAKNFIGDVKFTCRGRTVHFDVLYSRA
ncbi:MAG: hypothetical protein R3C03_19780 [Pirellulaceae bacterium]